MKCLKTSDEEHVVAFFKVRLSLDFPVLLSSLWLTCCEILAVSNVEQRWTLQQLATVTVLTWLNNSLGQILLIYCTPEVLFEITRNRHLEVFL